MVLPRRLGLVGLLAFLAAGPCACAGVITDTRREVSSGHVGCAPKDITISGEGDRSWTAHCAGAKYYCSVSASEQVACKLAVK